MTDEQTELLTSLLKTQYPKCKVYATKDDGMDVVRVQHSGGGEFGATFYYMNDSGIHSYTYEI